MRNLMSTRFKLKMQWISKSLFYLDFVELKDLVLHFFLSEKRWSVLNVLRV